jgi:exodeoxyribonuclease V alpha subunit
MEARSRGPVELFLPGDAVIVDEASMVDLPLLAWLLRSLGPQTRLIFVGDKDQLASVGPGSVLRDLIASGRIPVTLLTVIKRQGEGSPIVEAAHAINQGHLPARSTAAGDLYILRAKPTNEDAGVHAQRLVVESAVRLNAQVLSPQHTSPVGVSPSIARCRRASTRRSRGNPRCRSAPTSPSVLATSSSLARITIRRCASTARPVRCGHQSRVAHAPHRRRAG